MNDFLPFQKDMLQSKLMSYNITLSWTIMLFVVRSAEYLCNILFTWLRGRHDWRHSRYSGTLEWTRVDDCLIHRRVFTLVVDLFNVIWTQCLSIHTNLKIMTRLLL